MQFYCYYYYHFTPFLFLDLITFLGVDYIWSILLSQFTFTSKKRAIYWSVSRPGWSDVNSHTGTIIGSHLILWTWRNITTFQGFQIFFKYTHEVSFAKNNTNINKDNFTRLSKTFFVEVQLKKPVNTQNFSKFCPFFSVTTLILPSDNFAR